MAYREWVDAAETPEGSPRQGFAAIEVEVVHWGG